MLKGGVRKAEEGEGVWPWRTSKISTDRTNLVEGGGDSGLKEVAGVMSGGWEGTQALEEGYLPSTEAGRGLPWEPPRRERWSPVCSSCRTQLNEHLHGEPSLSLPWLGDHPGSPGSPILEGPSPHPDCHRWPTQLSLPQGCGHLEGEPRSSLPPLHLAQGVGSVGIPQVLLLQNG